MSALAELMCVCEDMCMWWRLPEQMIIQNLFCKMTDSVKMMLSHVAVIASEWVTKNKMIEMDNLKMIKEQIR